MDVLLLAGKEIVERNKQKDRFDKMSQDVNNNLNNKTAESEEKKWKKKKCQHLMVLSVDINIFMMFFRY